MSKRKASAVSNDMYPELSITDIYDLLPRIGVSLYCNEKSAYLVRVTISYSAMWPLNHLIHKHTSRIIIIHPYTLIIYFHISYITHTINIIL